MAWESLLSPVYNLLKDVGRWILRRLKPPDSVEVLRHRTKWKADFERNRDRLENNNVIVRDLKRMDSYPDVDEKGKGISAWFKTEYKDLYHRGLEVFLNVKSAKFVESENGWVFCRYDDQGAENLLVVGRIPYDVIREVDWAGDEYYPFPHVYCDFNRRHRKEPYEEIVLCRTHKGTEHNWYTDVAEYGAVRRLTKKLGGPDV